VRDMKHEQERTHRERAMEIKRSGINILLVDDELNFLEVVGKRLRKRNLNVHTCTGGQEALDFLDSTPPPVVDVVVLDLKMPGMDGLTTLRELKARHPEVEVIILSGHADVEMATRSLKLGAFDFLLKPMDFDELLFKVEDAFRKRTLNVPKPG
jgi:DNA-binding NtrC family response regulator